MNLYGEIRELQNSLWFFSLVFSVPQGLILPPLHSATYSLRSTPPDLFTSGPIAGMHVQMRIEGEDEIRRYFSKVTVCDSMFFYVVK